MKVYYSIGSKPSAKDYYILQEYTRLDGGERVLVYFEAKNNKWASHAIAFKDDLPQSGSTAVIDCPAGAIKEASVMFPKAFATTPIVVISPLSDTQSINGIPKYSVKKVTTDGFLIKLYNDDNDTRSPVFYWMAMAKS